MALTILTERDLPEQFQPGSMYRAPDFQARVEQFKAWCSSNHVFYYSRPRESFSERDAERLAIVAGCTKLLMEDMS